jgi:hypothetical protein
MIVSRDAHQAATVGRVNGFVSRDTKWSGHFRVARVSEAVSLFWWCSF